MARRAVYGLIVVSLWQSTVGFVKNPESGISVGSFSDCSTSLTFELTWRDKGTNVEFTMKYALPTLYSTGNWIALALSTDRRMGSDAVFDCIYDGTKQFVQRSNNVGQSNNLVSTSDSWITATTGSLSNNVLTCTFSAALNNAANIDFRADWYMFFGYGRYSGGSKNEHSSIPWITNAKVDFQSCTDLCGPNTQTVCKSATVGSTSATVGSTSVTVSPTTVKSTSNSGSQNISSSSPTGGSTSVTVSTGILTIATWIVCAVIGSVN